MTAQTSRRNFLQATAAMSAIAASSYARAAGANERIHIGMIGTGGRGRYHIGWLHRVSETEPLEITGACDIWKNNREAGLAEIEKRFNNKPTGFTDYRVLLADPDIDAVLIATPDHQHCGMLIDAVKAGKDAYVEKPIAMELDVLNRAYDAVTASDRIVQHGTQGRSSAGAAAIRDFIQSGKLGKILRVEESRSFYTPYWNNYAVPESESDTDWKAFLYGRPAQPFDADKHGHWMGYRDFSSGTVGGWMSHLSDFIHYATGCGYPQNAVSQGGIYSPTSDPRRTCTDTVTAILEYAEGFTMLFTTHFGNGANDYVLIMGTKGTMSIGAPDGNDSGMRGQVSGVGSDHPDRVASEIELDNTTDEDHMTNWVRCMRSRKQPAACMEWGYRHGVACILGDRAWEEGRKMAFDREKREIVPA
ncbi:MAG: hypothetical protein GC154_01005 [bacterium]|nr:hypothetical protein [bacterium]